MFTRIRNTVRVLSAPPPNPFEEPDLAFEEEIVEASAVSKYIGNVIEILVISLAAGIVFAPLLVRVFPISKSANVATFTAVAASLLGIFFEHIRMKVVGKIREKLNIHESVAPYFGHKISRTVNILRG